MPSTNDLQRSAALSAFLHQTLTASGGKMSFETFMNAALYHSTLGYYTSPDFRIGASGDFTTAAELSPLYAKCIANACLPVLSTYPSVLELGAGSGQFAFDLLTALEAKACLPEQYFIYEISPHCRAQQHALLSEKCPQFLSRVVWLETLPSAFSGVILANEVLDALPVQCFEIQHQQVLERCVTWDGSAFNWILQPASPALHETIAPLQLSEGYQSEFRPALTGFITSLAACLKQGLMLFADYGYGRTLYYHPARNTGTLTCFYQHQKHHEPLTRPGLQDITAHVDFTHVIEVASDAGCALAGYTTQAGFLLEAGLTEAVINAEMGSSEAEKFKLHQAVKTLTLPTEMGEVIKFMGLSKGVTYTLPGHQLADRRREL